MPTQTRTRAVSLDEVRSRVAEAGFPDDPSRAGSDRIGLEPELFPVRVDPEGRPAGRVPLHGEGGTLELLDTLARDVPWLAPRDPEEGAPRYHLAHGGTFTFEPGGQIEHSTAIHDTAAAALADVNHAREALCGAVRARGARLLKIGVDPWSDVEGDDALPQMLRAPRYHAMAEYFDRRSPFGRVMMRNTATIQVNLDLGPPGVDVERWQVTTLVSPLVTASFASSPGEGHVSRRARAWQHLDPTRTGFPRHVLDGPFDDPRAALVEAALAADVLLFRTEDGAEAGTPGFRFVDWMSAGHPVHGWPTADDLDYHLTTLFHEVRCRGFYELRAGEALPEPYSVAPVVLLCGVAYDDEARAAVKQLLWPHRGALHEQWVRAAKDGLRDGELADLATRTWELALAGARRLRAGYFEPHHLEAADAFLDRFTRQGRVPADELAEALAVDDAEALRWCAGDAPCPEEPARPGRALA